MSPLPQNNRKAEPLLLTPKVMRGRPLPQPDEGGDKDERGRVLIVGGSPELPGAVILAATAALRAGAGRLRIATGRSIAPYVGMSVPEGRVFALPETKSGAIDPAAAAQIGANAGKVDAVLIGPGMVDEEAVVALITGVLPHLKDGVLVLDAAALACISEDMHCLHGLNGRAILTPHALEMAQMLKVEKADVTQDPLAVARKAAADINAVIALKGAETFIAAPDGRTYRNTRGNVGLATSGSGDTLAGIIAGLAARGAEPLQAAAWGVYLHAVAGEALAERLGPIGYLARELAAEVPRLMRA